ncbi:MAG: hypothetical protein AAGE03_16205 [Pseudomonadota bacterium]
MKDALHEAGGENPLGVLRQLLVDLNLARLGDHLAMRLIKRFCRARGHNIQEFRVQRHALAVDDHANTVGAARTPKRLAIGAYGADFQEGAAEAHAGGHSMARLVGDGDLRNQTAIKLCFIIQHRKSRR